MNHKLFSISYHDISLIETARKFHPTHFKDYFLKDEPKWERPPINMFDMVRYVMFDQLTFSPLNCPQEVELFTGKHLGYHHSDRQTNMYDAGRLCAPLQAEINGFRVWVNTEPTVDWNPSTIEARLQIGQKYYFETLLAAFPSEDDLGLDEPVARPKGERLLILQGMLFKMVLSHIPVPKVNRITLGAALDVNLARVVQ